MTAIRAAHEGKAGVHPSYHKDLVAGQDIREMPLPSLLTVSMSQHLGAPAAPVVKKGDTVLRGQLIGQPAGFISAAVHAPTSGTVKAIVDAPTASGPAAQAALLEPDGDDAWVQDLAPLPDWARVPGRELVEKVADAGVTGMGGAGFPTHVKLSPPPEKPIDTVIVNGAECEPYLAADHRLMLEFADSVAEGCAIIRHILQAKVLRVAIEDNKPDAIETMEKAISRLDGDVAVSVLKTEYPQGAEKQQILAITGREVPSGGLPMDVGAVVENVGTTLAIRDAILEGMPLLRRVTSVTGYPVVRPSNVMARVGTSYADLVEFCGGLRAPAAKVISGGPMMGFAQHTLDVATAKTTSGVVLLSPRDVRNFTSMPCISCGRCVDACPSYLMPCELSQAIEAEHYESAEAMNVLDCIECGCCAFVCPSNRPLTQHMRRGKATAVARKREQQQKKA